ncbi:MAG: tyrosine-type recombinase/integrase [Desulfovibrionaceae bacterium]|nr:tyrosine-type recombinase/integrase [Desulfovibrionaceae bacterium]
MALEWCHAWQAFQYELAWGAGLAASTMRGVRYELALWAHWLTVNQRSWHEVTPGDLLAWLGAIVASQADKTVDRRVWVLRRLYRWAHLEGLIDSDPWQFITRPVRHRTWQPRYTPALSAIHGLLAQPDTRTVAGIRDRAIMELLYASGLRASELIGLKCHQVSAGAKDRCIKVMGKGLRERLVIYGDHAATWLRYYARAARPHLLRQAGPIDQCFVNDTRSGELTYPVLRRFIKRYAAASGQPLLTAHSLRHAFATHLYHGGANLRVIQMLLGHSHLQTTTVYVSTSTAHLRELLERHHPRGLHYRPQKFRRPLGMAARSCETCEKD